MTEGNGLRICFVCTHSLTLATLYKGLFPYLLSKGWDVTAIVGDNEYSQFPEKHFGNVQPVIIPMKRLPSPKDDIVGLYRFYRHFREHDYDVVHVSTPKASLLASIARRLTGKRGVIFVYRRCVYELMRGLKRQIYMFTDRLTAACSDKVVPISRQLLDFLGAQNITSERKLLLLGHGSSNGVDVDRFAPSAAITAQARQLMADLKLDPNRPILLFLGRVCSEKGVDVLPDVVEHVRRAHPGAQLVVAGPDDVRDPVSERTRSWIERDPDARRLGYVSDPASLFALCTVFVFPSYFEGFGNVLLEAASASKVSVAFDVPGVQEAVEHGVSGLLVPSGSAAAMGDAIIGLLDNPTKLASMEAQALDRVRRLFRRETIWAELNALFQRVARG